MSQTNHLIRRGGVWYYRRRVPFDMVSSFGKKEIQLSLDTSDLSEAKKRRAVEDLKWAARFEGLEKHPSKPAATNEQAGPPAPLCSALSEHEVTLLVQNYVARVDERANQRLLGNPPDNEQQKTEIRTDIEISLGILKDRDDPRAAELIYAAGTKILNEAEQQIDGKQLPYAGQIAEGNHLRRHHPRDGRTPHHCTSVPRHEARAVSGCLGLLAAAY